MCCIHTVNTVGFSLEKGGMESYCLMDIQSFSSAKWDESWDGCVIVTQQCESYFPYSVHLQMIRMVSSLLYVFYRDLKNRKEGNLDKCLNTGEPWRPFAEWNMPVAEGQMLFDSTYVKSQSNQIRGDRNRSVLARDWGREEGDFVFSRSRPSVLQDGKHLGMDSFESW